MAYLDGQSKRKGWYSTCITWVWTRWRVPVVCLSHASEYPAANSLEVKYHYISACWGPLHSGAKRHSLFVWKHHWWGSLFSSPSAQEAWCRLGLRERPHKEAQPRSQLPSASDQPTTRVKGTNDCKARQYHHYSHRAAKHLWIVGLSSLLITSLLDRAANTLLHKAVLLNCCSFLRSLAPQSKRTFFPFGLCAGNK